MSHFSSCSEFQPCQLNDKKRRNCGIKKINICIKIYIEQSTLTMAKFEIDEIVPVSAKEPECAAQHDLIIRYCRPIHIMCSLLHATT
jgi:hypothetical protein